MIECSLKDAKAIYTSSRIPCNYIFVYPPTPEELAIRLIRNRPGQDTQNSLLLKQNQMRKDIEEVKSLKWINKSFPDDRLDDFLKKTAIYIVFTLYKLKA